MTSLTVWDRHWCERTGEIKKRSPKPLRESFMQSEQSKSHSIPQKARSPWCTLHLKQKKKVKCHRVPGLEKPSSDSHLVYPSACRFFPHLLHVTQRETILRPICNSWKGILLLVTFLLLPPGNLLSFLLSPSFAGKIKETASSLKRRGWVLSWTILSKQLKDRTTRVQGDSFITGSQWPGGYGKDDGTIKCLS